MSNDRRQFTFLVSPSATSTFKQISIHYYLIYTVLTTLVVLFGGLVYGTIRLAHHEMLNLKYQSVKTDNLRLKQENTIYQNQYAKLKGQISFIEDMSKDIARQTKMEHISEIDEQVGAGGPSTVEALDKAAKQLERQVRIMGDRLHSDQIRLASIPSGLPVRGYQTDGYGMRRNPFGGGGEFHPGVDLAVDFGTPVATTADGIVIWAGPYTGYGNMVVVYHSNGITTRYGHLSRISVDPGQRIKRGDQIGYAGSTGRSTGPHVHYEVRENDQPVDPAQFVKQPRP